MKITLQFEEVALTIMAIYFLSRHGLGWPAWIWFLLFFTPDISMLGYLFGTRAGAFAYNLFHHRGLALVVAASGYWLRSDPITATGILLFAHASFDRIWGYGLKYADSFKHTHLGRLHPLR